MFYPNKQRPCELLHAFGSRFRTLAVVVVPDFCLDEHASNKHLFFFFTTTWFSSPCCRGPIPLLFWQQSTIPLEMATYRSKWQHTTRNGRVSLGCTRKALIEKGSGETLDPSSGDGEYSVYDQFLSSSFFLFFFLLIRTRSLTMLCVKL